MAFESWLTKVKTALSVGVLDAAGMPGKRRPRAVGVLAFEVAGVISKLLHLWKSLSDHHIVRLRSECTALEGVRKIVSGDEAVLLGLACAEIVDILRTLARSVSLICRRCEDRCLRRFDALLREFADSGRDHLGWAVAGRKEIECRHRKMDRYVAVTAALYREMEELTAAENALRRSSPQVQSSPSPSPYAAKDQRRILDLQQKISLQKLHVRQLKQKSLWSKTFDSVASLLVPSVFTVLARIKLVFGIGDPIPASLNRSLSASAVVYPSENHDAACEFTSGPLTKLPRKADPFSPGFLNEKLLDPPASTLGAAGLALHYANVIIVMERMIRSPQLVGAEARDDLYAMLPASIRSALRARLRGVGFFAGDAALAAEWKDALGRILGWIAPLAHNMMKWQGERSFEQRQGVRPRTNVLLLQTLYFADLEMTEAAITEMLVGLNYVWRFEREMTARALFECATFNGGGFPSQCSSG